jgi:hypothetical protein
MEDRPIIKKLAEFGSFSIGSVYLLVGVIAILSLFGEAEDDADEERIVDFLLDLPLGEVLITLIILGLVGYIIWRVFEAFKDPYNFGSDWKGLGKRAGIALSASGYAIIAFSAAQVLIGEGGNGEEDQQVMVAQVLNWQAGPWIIGAVGLITIFAGIVQFKFVIQGDYNKRLDIDHFTSNQLKGVHTLAYAGYFARGIILLVLGYFFMRAAINLDPEAVGDTDSAFDFIGGGWLGNIFFFVVAAGTISYGFLMFIFGLHYKFRKEDDNSYKEENE